MDDKTNEQDVDLNNEEDVEEELEGVEEEKETKAKEKPKRTPEEQLAYLEGRTQRLRKKLGLVEARKPKEETTDELGNAELAYLAAKGIEEDEDIEFIHSRMKKWDKSLREVLKDDELQAKLKAMKIERDVKNAMPSATKRTGQGSIDNLDYWMAKYEQSGFKEEALPDNFELRSAVINAQVNRSDHTRPSWRS